MVSKKDKVSERVKKADKTYREKLKRYLYKKHLTRDTRVSDKQHIKIEIVKAFYTVAKVSKRDLSLWINAEDPYIRDAVRWRLKNNV